jgi:hypothetical protein
MIRAAMSLRVPSSALSARISHPTLVEGRAVLLRVDAPSKESARHVCC